MDPKSAKGSCKVSNGLFDTSKLNWRIIKKSAGEEEGEKKGTRAIFSSNLSCAPLLENLDGENNIEIRNSLEVIRKSLPMYQERKIKFLSIKFSNDF